MKTPKTTTANRRLAPVPCSVTLAMGCTSEKIAKQLKAQKLRFKAGDAAYWQRVADALSLLRIHGYISPTQQHQGRQKLLKRIAAGCSQNKEYPDALSESHPQNRKP